MKRPTLTVLSSSLLALAIATGGALGATEARAESLEDVVKAGKVLLDVRYRFEHVDQTGLINNASAHTLRTRLGYQTGEYEGVSGLLEFENVARLGAEHYNDTINGNGTYPVIADPQATEVNQAYLNVKLPGESILRGGRQRIALDNHRFIGNVGFRQNEQTFDAVMGQTKFIPDTTATYAWIGNINRIFGDNSPQGDLSSDSHVVHVANNSLPFATVVAYAYLLKVKEAPALSTKTFGIRIDGSQQIGNDTTKILYTGEYARQSDYRNNPSNYGVDYYRVEGGATFAGFTLKAGYEVLGSDGVNAVSTPLATLHAHNGWADVFLNTPTNGLEDLFFTANYTVKGIEFLNGLGIGAVYHDYDSDVGSVNFGKEWGVVVSKPIVKNISAEFKYADYNSDTFASDRNKVWFAVNLKI